MCKIVKEVIIKHEGSIYKIIYDENGFPRNIERKENNSWVIVSGKLVTSVEYYGQILMQMDLEEGAYEFNPSVSPNKDSEGRVPLHPILNELGIGEMTSKEEIRELLKDKKKISNVAKKIKEVAGNK